MSTFKILSATRRGACLFNLGQNPLKQTPLQIGLRFYRHRNIYPMLKDLNKRREQIALDQKLRHGKEERPRRSEFLEWNYDCELVAFAARLGEKFDDSKLRQAFISLEYVEAEMRRQRELHIKDESMEDLLPSMPSNEKMAEFGRQVIVDSLRGYLRSALPYLPEEGVEAITEFLTEDKMLAHVSFHIGTMDLILTEEYPPSVKIMKAAFEAVIGALASDHRGRAQRLVLDLVATQLHGRDIVDIWDIKDPMGNLVQILANENRGQPEARLLWASGKETLLACYHVGIYSDKQLIGQAPGESAEIAEEMAARDALRRLFRFDDSSKPLPFGRDLKATELKATPNLSVQNWSTKNVATV